jgi:3-hydroxyisobutyrate dehydrogenase
MERMDADAGTPVADARSVPGSPHGERRSAGRPTEGAGLNVGFIGLGDMGGRIAMRILQGGFRLTVHDTRPAAWRLLQERGAMVAAGAKQLASSCSVIGICVVDDHQLCEVVAQMRDHLAEGTIVLIHSSVLPATAKKLAAELAARGVAVIDAPVSGSRPAADAGTLTVFAGGDAGSIQRVAALLDTFTANVIHAGQVGAGQALKIVNNVMLHMNHLVALEAVRFARSQGIDEATLIAATNVSTGRSWVTETWGLIDAMVNDHPLAGTDEIYPLMSKEMWHAVELGKATMTPLPLTALGTQLSEQYFRDREQDLKVAADAAVSLSHG